MKIVGPSAVAQDPLMGPERVTSIICSNNSWALSGGPQWYTEPPLPSAERCTIPFLDGGLLAIPEYTCSVPSAPEIALTIYISGLNILNKLNYRCNGPQTC